MDTIRSELNKFAETYQQESSIDPVSTKVKSPFENAEGISLPSVSTVIQVT